MLIWLLFNILILFVVELDGYLVDVELVVARLVVFVE